MSKITLPLRAAARAAAGLAAAAMFAGCSPEYNWREVSGANASYTVLLPAKPASYSRPVNLDGVSVTMTMTAAEVSDTTFAVGTAELPSAAQAPAALLAMKTALLRNINGDVRKEKLTGPAEAPVAIELEAVGSPARNAGKEARVLFARFAARDGHIYQAIVLGQEKTVSREAVETFLTSFKY